MTLLIVLLVLLCQFSTSSAAFSVQYPHGEHPSGSQVNHHHGHFSHGDNEHANSPVHQHSHQSELRFNAIETQQDILESTATSTDSVLIDNAKTDHEHSSHSHAPSHPPIESVFVAEFTHTSTISDNETAYATVHYAPPIPPPHQ
ncbi:hypothetical protein J8L86_16060 [Shewanella sp. MMG014]|nr:hypothetical protein [Shewanella sp. MMG014]